MSKRSPRLNGTEDEQVVELAGDKAAGDAAAGTGGKLRFHPMYAERLRADIRGRQDALAAAARQAVPSLARTIERMRACPDGIDPGLALRSADLLYAALIAIQESLTLDGAADREGFNRLKREMDDLQLRLTDAVEQIVAEKIRSG